MSQGARQTAVGGERGARNRFPCYRLAALGLALLAAGACSSPAKQPIQAALVEVSTVRRGTIARLVRTEAILYPLHEAVLVPKITAPIEKFYVRRGEQVKRGQLVAMLDNADLHAAVLRDRGLYQQAKAQYETATSSSLPEQLQQAQTAEASARQQYVAEQRLFNSRRQLYREGALPRMQLDQAQVGFVQARSQWLVARRKLHKLLAIGRQAQLQSAAGQLAAAQGAYEAVRAQLSFSLLRSPITGVVTDRPLYPGQLATPATPLMTIMNLNQVIARAHLAPAAASLLHAGDPAMLTAAGVKAAGKVMVVSPALDPNSATVQVWIRAANPGRRLRPGDTARVTIRATRPRPALLIPASAVLPGRGGKSFVMVVGAGRKAKRVPVRLGIEAQGEAEVLSGLKAGDTVITVGAFGLPNGTRVKVEPAGNGGASPQGTAALPPAGAAGQDVA